MSLTRTNHGTLVPMPQPSVATPSLPVLAPGGRRHRPWILWPTSSCRRCGVKGALQYYVINDDHGDERWKCARELGGCGDTFVAEGPDA